MNDLTCTKNENQAIFLQNVFTDRKKRSPVIEETLERIDKALRHPTKLLVDAQYRNGRKIRSERRVTALEILKIILLHADYQTLELSGFQLKRMSELLGKSLKAVKRAFAWLCKCGYLFSNKLHVRDLDGRYIGLASVKTISKKLFISLGISLLKVDRLRAYKQKSLKHKLRKERHTHLLSLKDYFTSESKNHHEQPAARKEFLQNCGALAYELYLSDPSKSIAEHYQDIIQTT
jgi:hypothetical protein